LKGIDLFGKAFWIVFVIVSGLLLATIITLIIASPTWAPKSFLFEQELLISVIGVLGVITASVIALGSLLFVNRQIQTYSWRRDQTLTDIKDIYIPLYGEVDKLLEELDDYRPSWGEPQQWSRIQGSYLETKLRLTNKQLYIRLGEFYGGLTSCRDSISEAVELVQAIARTKLEEHLETLPSGLQPEIKESILKDIPVSMDYERFIYSGFLKGRSLRESSKLKYRGNENYLMEWAIKQVLRRESYWQSINLSSEQLELMYDEIFQRVKGDKRIQQIVSICESFVNQGKQLKKDLDKTIVRPQLL